MSFFDDIGNREVKAPKNPALLAGITQLEVQEAAFRKSERGNGQYLLITGKVLGFRAADVCYDTNACSPGDIPEDGYTLVGDEGIRKGVTGKVLVSAKAYSCTMSAETFIDAVGINFKLAEGGSPGDHYEEWNAMEPADRRAIAESLLGPESSAVGQVVDVKVSYTRDKDTGEIKFKSDNVPAFTKNQFGYAGRWFK